METTLLCACSNSFNDLIRTHTTGGKGNETPRGEATPYQMELFFFTYVANRRFNNALTETKKLTERVRVRLCVWGGTQKKLTKQKQVRPNHQ